MKKIQWPGKMIKEVLSSVFKKPATINYPHVKSPMAEKFRGKIIFHPEKCIGCMMCMKDCPSGAIVIKKVGEKKFEAEFDLAKCIYCAQCVDSCLKNALEFSGEYDLAQLKRGKLKIEFHADSQSTP